jgi:hypothetical protein
MYSYQKPPLLRWWASLLLASTLAVSLLAIQSTYAFAANAPCTPSSPLNTSAGSAACDMAISAIVNSGVLTLTNDATAVVAGTPFTLLGSPIFATFTFTSVAKDHRGLALGWVLSAASAGIVNGTTTLPLSLTAKDAASSCINGTCLPTTFTPITLTTTPARFLTAGDASHTLAIDGDYSNKTDGAFTIPPGSPSGTYSGIISITLLNTF